MVNTNCKKFKKNKNHWNRRKNMYIYIYILLKKSCYYFPPILPFALRSAAMWHRPFSVPPWTQDASHQDYDMFSRESQPFNLHLPLLLGEDSIQTSKTKYSSLECDWLCVSIGMLFKGSFHLRCCEMMSSFLAKVDLAATTACAQHFAWDLKTQPLVFSRCVHLPFSFLSENNQRAKQKNMTSASKNLQVSPCYFVRSPYLPVN